MIYSLRKVLLSAIISFSFKTPYSYMFDVLFDVLFHSVYLIVPYNQLQLRQCCICQLNCPNRWVHNGLGQLLVDMQIFSLCPCKT